jgi:glycosyltransferase involved in cell wall biosynthesis
LECLVEQLGLADRVRIEQPIPHADIWHLLRQAFVGVVMYRNTCRNNYYCAPTKLSEYLAVGVPVIVSNFPGMLEFLEEYTCGVAVDPESPTDIAAGINHMLRDPEVYDRMRGQARLYFDEELNWTAESRKLIGVFRDLLDLPHGNHAAKGRRARAREEIGG